MQANDNAMVLAAFILFFSVAFIWPTVRVWRQTGRNPYVLPSTDDAFGFVSRCMKVLMLALLLYGVGQLIWPDIVTRLSLLPQESASIVSRLAWAAMAGAIVWTICAQFQMGNSWRIGIDNSEKTALVTRGLFAWSRNPIFLAMRVCLAALALLQPNAITFALFIAGDLIMQFQVRLEEAFLRGQHGAAYASYCASVRRWL